MIRLAREVLRLGKHRTTRSHQAIAMNPSTPPSIPTPYQSHDFPPTDFVAYLAQSNGLSEEAAELRLASWLRDYYASASGRGRQDRVKAPHAA